MRFHTKALLMAAVFLFSAVLFSNTLGYGRVWDDIELLERVETILDQDGLLGLLTSDFRMVEPLGYYRPIVHLSLALDTMLSSENFSAFHLTNVLIHSANCALVCLLFLGMGFSPLPSAAGAAIFAAHPVHSESVAFISGRTDLLAFLFIILSTILWLDARTVGRRYARTRQLLSLLFFLAAGLSKETAFMLPSVLFLWGLCSPREEGREGILGRIRSQRLWILGWSLIVIAVLAIRSAAVHVPLAGFTTATGHGPGPIFGNHPALITGIAVHYLRLLVLPIGLSVLHEAADLSLSVPSFLFAGLFLALPFLVPGTPATRRRWLPLAWTALFLFPVSGVFHLKASILAERFLYLPSLGAAMILAGCVQHPATSHRRRAAAWVLCVAILASFSALTLERNKVWASEETLYASMVRTCPRSPQGYYNLGLISSQQADFGKAAFFYRQAIDRDPGHWKAYTCLGIDAMRTGDFSAAEKEFKTALTLSPGNPLVLQNLDALSARTGSGTDGTDVTRP